jgi:hypothetical protein
MSNMTNASSVEKLLLIREALTSTSELDMWKEEVKVVFLPTNVKDEKLGWDKHKSRLETRLDCT